MRCPDRDSSGRKLINHYSSIWQEKKGGGGGSLHGNDFFLVGVFFCGRRGRFYGITLLYRKDPRPFREDLPKLIDLLAAGKIRPRIAARLPLLAAGEAGAMLERGGIEGKIVHLA